jgi:tripartite-type tricarboxylate transporter receptor subunit TctC
MNEPRTRRALAAVAGVLMGAFMLACATGPARADDRYPSKPVRIVVGFPPGSATDVAARRVAQKLTVTMGQAFFVENRPGASGSVAADITAKAPADGYTLFAGTTSEIAINRPIGMKVSYDAAKDFMPVALLFTSNAVLLASNESGFKSLKDLTAAARARPGTVSIAAVNAFQQVVVAAFERAANVKLNPIYYKGTALALNDVLAGQINGMVGYPAESLPNVSAGKARALAIVGAQRNPFMADVPTTTEAGLPVPDLVVWGAIFAPTGTPVAVVEQLNREIVAASNSPEIKSELAKTGSNYQPYSMVEFKGFVTNEIAKWDRVVKDTGIRIEQ